MINKREKVQEARSKLKWSLWSYHFKTVYKWEKYEWKTPAMKLVNIMRRYMKKFPEWLTPEEKVKYSYDIMLKKYKNNRYLIKKTKEL